MYSLAILLFDAVEVLDFAGPFEVFSVCGGEAEEPPPFSVVTVAQQSPVTARNGLVIAPTYTLDNCPPTDLLLVPGGGGIHPDGTPYGSRREMNNPVLLDWLRHRSTQAQLLLSVCTGSLILARAGLLQGMQATTHWQAIDDLRTAAPHTKVVPEARWIDSGTVISSAGVSAGIDMSLYVISRLLDADTAAATARYMQYDHWQARWSYK